MSTLSKRIQWIDVAKGCGITLVVLGHASTPAGLFKFIYSFHLPLFFFLSGLVFVPGRHEQFVDFAKARARSLLVPYFVFSFVTYLFWVFVERRFGGDSSLSIWIPMKGIFYAVGTGHMLEHNPPIWFLPCLFVIEVGFLLMVSHAKTTGALVGLALAGGLIGFASTYLPLRLPWNADVAFTGVVFYTLGHLLKGRLDFAWKRAYLHPAIALCLAAGIVLLLSQTNDAVVMRSNRYGNVALFYLTAVAGIAMSVLAAQLLKNSRILTYLGRNTLTIMCLHFMAFSMTKGVLVLVLGVELETTYHSVGWGVFYATVALLLLVPVCRIVNDYFPFVLGRWTSPG